uniref:LamG-like jellyroll fold domain-containing protein n=1 Tax=Flavobacterium sp. TaxID=239 RepID=UPI0037522702
PVSATTNTGCTATGVVLTVPTTADNCAVASVTNNHPSTTYSLGNTTVTWTVTDGAGNTATATQVVTVTDTVKPTISTVPVSATTNTGCTATGVVLTVPTTADNCAVASVTNDHPSTTYSLGNTTVTWTVTDGAGNTATATQVVTVTDTVNPSISTVPVSATTNTGCTATIAILTAPTTTDNCSVASVTNDHPSTTYSLGNTTVNWTVTDGAGNTATATQVVTVTDTVNPIINSITNISTSVTSGTCSKSVTTTNPTTSDNCTVAKLTWTMNGATIASSPLTGINTIGTYSFNLGITTITYYVFDAAGNSSNTVYTVTITDNIAPTIICPGNLTVNVGTGTCSASVTTSNPTIADNCAVTKLTWNLTGATTGVSAATGINNLGAKVFNLGLTTVSYRVEDAAGNFATCSYTVKVIDNELPSITSLPAITANCSVTISVPPTSPDNCGTITGVTGDITLPYTFSTPGFYIVGWNFTDASGNSKNISQTITVVDNTAPVPSAASLPNLNFTACELLSSQLTYPTAIDGCNGTIVGVPNVLFPYSVLGNSIITWTYTDTTGNVSSQNQNIQMTSEVIDGGILKGYLTSAGATTAATVVNITSCNSGGNEIKINLTGQIGTIVQWEKYEVGDAIWVSIPNTTNNYTVTFYPATTESTFFRALIKVNSCYQYSSSFYVRALPADKPPILVQSLFNICLNENVTLVARRGYTIQEDALAGKGGDFNTGQFPDKFNDDMWRIDGKPSASHWTANGNATKDTNWAGTNPHPFGTITYDSGDPKFGIAQGNYYSSWIQQKQPQVYTTVSTLETPIFSLKNMSSASLNFDQAYNLVSGDYIKLELSLDGGLTYTITLQSFIGPKTWDWASHLGSTATQYNFQNDNSTFDLTPYVGQPKVRARWTFHGTSDKSVWAIDGITIPIVPKLDAIEWTDGIGNPGIPPIANGVLESSFTYTPEAPGKHQYGATVLVDGCRSYDASGTAMADVNVSYSYAGNNITLGPEVCGSNTVKLNAYDNSKTANQNEAKGSYTAPIGCLTCNDPGTEVVGSWSITGSSSCGTGTFSNINDPDAIFTGEVGSYVLTWTVKGCSSSVNVLISNCSTVDFDGTNDYIDFKKQNYDLNSNFSIEVWVKTAVSSSNIQTIFSKRNGNVLGNGYDLRVQNDYVTFRWNGTGSLTSPHKIGSNRWYHIAVTYSNSEYKLYIDGILMGTKNGSSLPIVNTYKALLGAMDQDNNAPNNPINYFKGWIDEFKIWNVALTDEQIRQMMNQEIKEQITGNNVVYGEIIPMPIYGLTWSNLKGYYRMNQFGCGYLKPNFGVGVDGKLKNITSAEPQTAPLPYYSIIGGDWTDTTSTTPWAYGNSVWDYPNSKGINGADIDWNIVRSLHNINSTAKDITLLGLKVESGKLTIAKPSQPLDEKNNGQGLWITHYLKLDGNIDLVGESQLVEKRYTTNQFSESILDETSTGFIKRDQQGKKNSYNYNYWSSPVSIIQGSLNNMPYIIKDLIKDGTSSANPKTINFGTAFDFADGTISNPIKTSDRWIWSYNSQILQGDEWANYYQWSHITSQGAIKVGEAFTMKGTGGVANVTDTQNYSFIGKPNSGTITLNLTQDNSYLIGNPYPSALDADEFIKDNLKDCLGCRSTVNSFSGALYFWDHFGLSNNHILAEYEGGYATYTLMGGVAAINNSALNLNDGAIGSNVPKRYIPVAQGFFIDGYIDFEVVGAQIPTVVQGGPILFKNNQRVFQRESTPSSVFMKKRETAKTSADSRQKIRLGFESSIGAHRQILVGIDSNATNQFDIGYDAPIYDINENDMYWEINTNKFVIQAVPNFNTEQTIPLGIVTKNEGEVKIKIDELENISSNTTVYLYDNQTEIYHDLRNSEFKITLAIGEFNKRFSLKFNKNQTQQLLDVQENESSDDIMVYYSKKTLFIKNNELDTTVNKVSLFNISGQAVENQKTENQEQQNIQVPVKNVSSGVYIAKLKTSEGVEISKKVIVFDD